jgi:L-ascorbate metabolism protein UlaG (beta-lactamase superfamily)
MELYWYGLSCFRLTERNMASVITDPYNGDKVGLSNLKTRADVVTISHDAPGHNDQKAVSGTRHVLTGPGEYEIGDVFITGIPTPVNDADMTPNVLFLFDFSGLKVAHLGDMAKVPSQSQIDSLELVNILLVPVGGGNSLNAAQAAELVSMLEPNIVIPMHYKMPGLNLELDEVDRFLKEMGVTDVDEESVLRVSASTVPEETQVVLLTSRGN